MPSGRHDIPVLSVNKPVVWRKINALVLNGVPVLIRNVINVKCSLAMLRSFCHTFWQSQWWRHHTTQSVPQGVQWLTNRGNWPRTHLYHKHICLVSPRMMAKCICTYQCSPHRGWDMMEQVQCCWDHKLQLRISKTPKQQGLLCHICPQTITSDPLCGITLSFVSVYKDKNCGCM